MPMIAIPDHLKILENQRGGLQIIYFLNKKKKAILSDFIYELKIPTSSIMRAINTLKKLELIKESNIPGSNRRIFELTSLGEEVAEIIEELNKVLSKRGLGKYMMTKNGEGEEKNE